MAYLRFGNIPNNCRSKNGRTGELEEGVSVWECYIVNRVPFPKLPSNPTEDCLADYFYMLLGNRQVFLVEGTQVGVGSDEEPLLGDDTAIVEELTAEYEYLRKIHSSECYSMKNSMREPTEEERQAVNDYIDSISVDTGVNFWDSSSKMKT